VIAWTPVGGPGTLLVVGFPTDGRGGAVDRVFFGAAKETP
jgi:hypothetical protein